MSTLETHPVRSLDPACDGNHRLRTRDRTATVPTAGWTVRTGDEFSNGHPAGAINIPAFFSTAAGMQPNPEFVAQVRISARLSLFHGEQGSLDGHRYRLVVPPKARLRGPVMPSRQKRCLKQPGDSAREMDPEILRSLSLQ